MTRNQEKISQGSTFQIDIKQAPKNDYGAFEEAKENLDDSHEPCNIALKITENIENDSENLSPQFVFRNR